MSAGSGATAGKSGVSMFRDEPYRIFFPLAFFSGISGVSHWALFAWWGGTWNVELHMALQAGGYLALTAVGFLGTAVPRLTRTGPLSRVEFTGLLITGLLILILPAFQAYGWTRAAFILLLFQLALAGVRRVLRASSDVMDKSGPPPNMKWIPVGVILGISGLLLSNFGYYRANALWTQGLVMALVLGVGPFIGNRLMGRRPFFGETRRGFIFRALVLSGTFIAEVFLDPTKTNTFAVYILRCLVVADALRVSRLLLPPPAEAEVPCSKAQGWYLWFSFLSLPVGLLIAALFPAYKTAGLHVLFISGFSLMILMVAFRVIFAHSGRGEFLLRNSWPFHLIGLLVIGSAVTRSIVGLFPSNFVPLIGIAGVLWLSAHAIFFMLALPNFFRRPAQEEEGC